MKEFSVAMSLMDYVPVILFGISSGMLQHDLYNKMNKGVFAIFAAGTINVFMSGFLKATYKLLYALKICDFEPLSQMFFPVQSLGFLLAGVAIVSMFATRNIKTMAVAPVLFKGTFLFISAMVAGIACIFGSVAVLAVKLKKKWLVPILVLAFFCYIAMGYLSTRDFNKASMNWIGEAVNTLGQLGLLFGVRVLRKAGLREYKL